MEDWLQAAASDAGPGAAPGARPAVLVTVAASEGSVPREPGARMLVDATRQWGTVGGGHLELRGVETARAMLANGETRRLERFPLGPSLGQCCGGVVQLAFELLDRDHAALLAARSNEDSWRLVALDGAPDLALFDAAGQCLQGSARPGFTRGHGAPQFTHIMREPDGRRWLVDKVAAPQAHLMLFGAGHVGAAIVRALAELPCRVTWVDEREDLFPAQVPANVTVEATDTPEVLAERAAPGTSFLVMTHSHALDQRLAEAILKRPSFETDWFGLIGSHTKRKQFEHRLRDRGIAQARLASMVCPIGVPGIEGKQPAVIAVAVAAQLLMVWEARTANLASRETI
ncbi:xanthine dehydrogenase accessory protein XdhC [Massilia norwichensis]|uniref:Xanthine dehydrogenase accessory protein XdhC n=1 Tax=Massilia norwichensis TaxID=1442366 RepID=A0ABT2A8P8_9BURK|nr:xanthine dehydrogenase accessory protein XdhC [Massilia norwichensis]MCS0590503.1 xanthine dehydrogenase accessory protein XdhC [Massilia norwichensis]